MKFLRRAYFALLYSLPAVLFFSYYPVIRLGSDASMNFELSLPLLWLVIFDIIAFVELLWHKSFSLGAIKRASTRAAKSDSPVRTGAGADCKQAKGLMLEQFTTISDRKFFLFALFPFYATLSIFWSANATRAILTAGIIWLLFFAVFAIIYVTPLLHPAQHFRSNLLKVFFVSSIIICFVCWAQAILDVCGVGRESTLLCPGCISQTFGFPHPSGFAIEPQFMGNLLLAPTLLSLWVLVKRPEKIRVASLARLALLFSATLFLTFSRGAIYAFAIAFVILLVFAFIRHQFRASLVIVPVIAFVFTLTMQGIFTVVGPTHGSFCLGITKSVHQLSLSVIDLRSACPTTPAQASMIQQISYQYAVPEDFATEILARTQSTFDGYIAESTDIRLNLNTAALQTWFAAPGVHLRTTRIGHDCPPNQPFNDACAAYTTIDYNPRSILFGVGLGGAGTALYKNRAVTNITTPKEIVQNQPISLLLELGLVGIALVVFSLLIAFFPQIFPAKFVDGRAATTQRPANALRHHPALPLLVALIIAYIITLQFFSGLPNALHIYLLPPLLYLILVNSEKTLAIDK